MAETPDSPLEIEKGAATKLDPDRVGDELPQEAEWLYLGAFMAALDAYEDEPEGAHYAAAWDVVNDLFDKPAEADEDERVDWEFQGESKNLVSKIDSILEGRLEEKDLGPERTIVKYLKSKSPGRSHKREDLYGFINIMAPDGNKQTLEMIKEDLKNQKYSQLAGDLVRAVQGSKMDTSGFENIALRDAANNYLHRKSEVLVKAINSYMSSQGM